MAHIIPTTWPNNWQMHKTNLDLKKNDLSFRDHKFLIKRLSKLQQTSKYNKTAHLKNMYCLFESSCMRFNHCVFRKALFICILCNLTKSTAALWPFPCALLPTTV